MSNGRWPKGTDPLTIYNIIKQSSDYRNILILADISSAILSAETAIGLIEDESLKNKVTLVNASLFEGAFVASLTTILLVMWYNFRRYHSGLH